MAGVVVVGKKSSEKILERLEISKLFISIAPIYT
jgi:hypothetical protein